MPTTPPTPPPSAAALLDRLHFELVPMVDAGPDLGYHPAAAEEPPTVWSLYRLVQVVGPDGRAYLERGLVLDCATERDGLRCLRLARQLLAPEPAPRRRGLRPKGTSE